MKFPTGNQSSEIMEPREQPFYFPPTSITPQNPAILAFGLFPVRLMGGYKLSSILLQKAFIKWIAIIRFITNYPFRRFTDKAIFDRALNQLHFVG
jgi:hypothetical protein